MAGQASYVPMDGLEMDLASAVMGEEGLAKLSLTAAASSVSRSSLKSPAHNTPPHQPAERGEEGNHFRS